MQLDEEPDDETLLVRTIKSQNKEQKAKQSYAQNIRFFQDEEFNATPGNEADFRRSNSLMFYKSSMKEQGRMTSNNFFRHSPTREGSDSVSELTSSVVAGGSMSILRQKTLKYGASSIAAKPLSNDI